MKKMTGIKFDMGNIRHTVTTAFSHFSLYMYRGHGGRVVTLSPPTSEVRVRFPTWPQVGKLVVVCRWSAVYNTQP